MASPPLLFDKAEKTRLTDMAAKDTTKILPAANF